jgi:flagellin-like hook-associated protein FlgL
MTVSSMTNWFTATLKRQANTTSVNGDKVLAFSTANRTTDGVPTSVSATFQTATSEEKIAYGVKETNMAWRMYASSDPELTTEDQVSWTDSGSIARVCRVVGPSFDMAGKATIWKAIVSEMKNRS